MTTPHRRKQMAEATARLKAKRKEAGLVRLELWVRPDDVKHVKAYACGIEAERKGARPLNP